MDIDGWLRGIGLAQYSEMLRANDIDIELLRRLTSDDLKDRANGSRPAIFSPRSMAGSPKASTRSI